MSEIPPSDKDAYDFSFVELIWRNYRNFAYRHHRPHWPALASCQPSSCCLQELESALNNYLTTRRSRISREARGIKVDRSTHHPLSHKTARDDCETRRAPLVLGHGREFVSSLQPQLPPASFLPKSPAVCGISWHDPQTRANIS